MKFDNGIARALLAIAIPLFNFVSTLSHMDSIQKAGKKIGNFMKCCKSYGSFFKLGTFYVRKGGASRAF